MEDAARWHDSKILYWHVNKLRGNSCSGLVLVEDRYSATISNKGNVEGRWAVHFVNMLNQNRDTGKDLEENKKVCDMLDVKEDLFCKEELATVPKE